MRSFGKVIVLKLLWIRILLWRQIYFEHATPSPRYRYHMHKIMSSYKISTVVLELGVPKELFAARNFHSLSQKANETRSFRFFAVPRGGARKNGLFRKNVSGLKTSSTIISAGTVQVLSDPVSKLLRLIENIISLRG